jgi:hypothetical protein
VLALESLAASHERMATAFEAIAVAHGHAAEQAPHVVDAMQAIASALELDVVEVPFDDN